MAVMARGRSRSTSGRPISRPATAPGCCRRCATRCASSTRDWTWTAMTCRGPARRSSVRPAADCSSAGWATTRSASAASSAWTSEPARSSACTWHPRWRGRGVARRLLRELEDLARRLGYETARLDTGPRQAARAGCTSPRATPRSGTSTRIRSRPSGARSPCMPTSAGVERAPAATADRAPARARRRPAGVRSRAQPAADGDRRDGRGRGVAGRRSTCSPRSPTRCGSSAPAGAHAEPGDARHSWPPSITG